MWSNVLVLALALALELVLELETIWARCNRKERIDKKKKNPSQKINYLVNY